jgi:ATP-dependent DNA helicase DinG
MTSFVALDLETTGLDPKSDSIIEVGAHKFSGNRTEDELTTLINPNKIIPEFITGLTGISNAMVRNSPFIRDIIPDLVAFIGDAPIVGHNIKFDLSFLEKYTPLSGNERIDTFEMASVLIPAASRYNLGALGKQLGIILPATHRALDDARVTAAVYQALFSKINELPIDVVVEIVRYCETIDWDGAWPFQEILRLHAFKDKNEKEIHHEILWDRIPHKKLAGQTFPTLSIPEEPTPIDIEQAVSMVDYGSSFSNQFKNYEHRVEQLDMLRSIAKALSKGQHLMVEAGTGVGKSFAYLVPAVLFAVQNNTRVLISTNTINLLIKKDIPDLCSALNINLFASVLKGRSNYLCPRRLDLLRHRMPVNSDELRVLAKILIWLLENRSGDRTDITLTGPSEREIWLRLSADDDKCNDETCLERQGGACPFFKAKQAAQYSQILVVNHALLLTDVAVGNRILPEYQYLIIDEGHHLESATTSALSFHLTQWDIEHLIREVGGEKSGLFGHIIGNTSLSILPSDFALLNQKGERAIDLSWSLQEQIRKFFESFSNFVSHIREGQPSSSYAWQERLLPATRTQPGWDSVEITWENASGTINQLIQITSDLQKYLSDIYSDGMDTLEEVISNLAIFYRRITEIDNMVGEMIFEPSVDKVYWVDMNPTNNKLSLNSSPIHVGSLVEKHLWHEKRSVILTSATLTTNGTFDYIRGTLTADEADELVLGSPFDFENAALLYIANDIAEPHTSEYQHQVESTIINLSKASGGRTLVLFTSYAQLKRTAKAITSSLNNDNILVYEQGDGASANALLESFKSSERAVLLGTRSFWEGIDIPGEALSVLIIVKLPFAVPSDPLVAARAESYEDPFNEYHLPEAILRFRQGFGRLIRTQADRGVVVILDRRLLTKSYGRAFLESLPACTRKIGPVAGLPGSVIKWLHL